MENLEDNAEKITNFCFEVALRLMLTTLGILLIWFANSHHLAECNKFISFFFEVWGTYISLGAILMKPEDWHKLSF